MAGIMSGHAGVLVVWGGGLTAVSKGPQRRKHSEPRPRGSSGHLSLWPSAWLVPAGPNKGHPSVSPPCPQHGSGALLGIWTHLRKDRLLPLGGWGLGFVPMQGVPSGGACLSSSGTWSVPPSGAAGTPLVLDGGKEAATSCSELVPWGCRSPGELLFRRTFSLPPFCVLRGAELTSECGPPLLPQSTLC